MTQDRRSLRALSALLPTGILGLSIGLASADGMAATSSGERAMPKDSDSVALRLQAIRNSVSVVVQLPAPVGDEAGLPEAEPRLAWWGNGWHRGWGWHNGGWGNGGWHNGGWGNGGWGNGGWHNGGWGNGGWHNGGWGNGWHNW
ncbi:MAG: rSAM-associated Gly-rich repeat protein [Reyranella sp.]|uniref:GrrA/OscA1 family cyclophane-containing rSAM-modified RiPP n=1 Tax=Reyranella sp. TaxID=1929291 RepID=UPI0011FD1785|nr:GrrA/OscA1 family cyclophane-containing rSAM-modified RiPP [Reyranella sp.]TAJ42208.1 MAG: rSAM-associated Gly-rich repeat protein [Reyranella sp.]